MSRGNPWLQQQQQRRLLLLLLSPCWACGRVSCQVGTAGER
jgi:hypothetical protein